MRIQHNIMAMNSYRNLSMNNSKLSKNLEKLSSGYRINRAGDDAAGLAISEKMRSQIAGLDQAQKNAQSGINLVQTAEGALTEVHDMLNRMVTLATQAANGTYGESDRDKIQSEIDSLSEEIDRIADNSNFNGKKLLDGSLSNSSVAKGNYGGVALVASAGEDADNATIKFAIDSTTDKTGFEATYTTGGTAVVTFYTKNADVSASAAEITSAVKEAVADVMNADGYTADDADAAMQSFNLTGGTVSFTKGDTTTKAADATLTLAHDATIEGALQLQIGSSAKETITVGVDSMKADALGIKGLQVGDEAEANAAIDTINSAIELVSCQRSNLGAIQNRLEHTINNLGVMEENIQDAEANIRDTDIADEMMAYTKNNILIQSAQAMLAQANQVPQGVLQLMQ